MNILFISNFPIMYSHLSGYVPLGIIYLASVLKQAGHHVDVCSSRLSDIRKAIKKVNPFIVAYSVCTGGIKEYLALNRKIKSEYNVFSVFGGPHPTYFPEMIEEDGVDAICRGEGESAMLELVNVLESCKDITSLKNWWVKKNNKIYKNQVKPLIQNLDTIPYPDRSLFFNKYPQMAQSPKKIFMASRGCVFNCAYCFNQKFNELYKNCNIMRRRSVDNVIKEVLSVINIHKTQLVQFMDDTFILDAKWIKEFSREYAKKVALPFVCNVRADLITEEIVKDLKAGGCFLVMFGIESGNDQIRSRILKRNMSNEQIIHTSTLLKQYGIKFITFNIIGIPGEDLKDIYQTIQLNRICEPTYPYASILQPYPGTDIAKLWLEEETIENQIIQNKYKEIPFSLHKKSLFHKKYDFQLNNIHRLFAVFVALPDSKLLFIVIIRLPITFVYTIIGKIWSAYCYRRLYNPRLTISQFFIGIWDLFFKSPI
ncbi:MAG: radical SAM protein [Deltaproteobacteria bacterium]|nr:radical SAM protein [Deltaproteobacteria bacterium]